MRILTRRRWAVSLAAALLMAPLATGTAHAAERRPTVTEHYHGRTYVLDPSNWNGAHLCAITARTDAYCFDSDGDFSTFLTTAASAPGDDRLLAAGASASASCNGWVKIWNGPNFTNRGLAFRDMDSQDLSDYVSVPFNIVSWFTDGGGRGVAPMTNCHANTGLGPGLFNLTEHTNAEARSIDPRPAYWITISYGVY